MADSYDEQTGRLVRALSAEVAQRARSDRAALSDGAWDYPLYRLTCVPLLARRAPLAGRAPGRLARAARSPGELRGQPPARSGFRRFRSECVDSPPAAATAPRRVRRPVAPQRSGRACLRRAGVDRGSGARRSQSARSWGPASSVRRPTGSAPRGCGFRACGVEDRPTAGTGARTRRSRPARTVQQELRTRHSAPRSPRWLRRRSQPRPGCHRTGEGRTGISPAGTCELPRRQTWLMDWEDAGWAPPGTDELYFAATTAALHSKPAHPLALAGRYPRSGGATSRRDREPTHRSVRKTTAGGVC